MLYTTTPLTLALIIHTHTRARCTILRLRVLLCLLYIDALWVVAVVAR